MAEEDAKKDIFKCEWELDATAQHITDAELRILNAEEYLRKAKEQVLAAKGEANTDTGDWKPTQDSPLAKWLKDVIRFLESAGDGGGFVLGKSDIRTLKKILWALLNGEKEVAQETEGKEKGE